MDGQGKNYNVNDSLIIDCKCRLQMNKGLSLHGFNTYMLLISSEEKSKGYNVYWYLKPEVCFHQSGKVHKKVFRHKALTSHTFNTSGMKSNSSSQVLKYHRIKKKKLSIKTWVCVQRDICVMHISISLVRDAQQPSHLCVICWCVRSTLYYISWLVSLLLSSDRGKISPLMRAAAVHCSVWRRLSEKLTTEAAHTCLSPQSGFKPGPCTRIVMTPGLNFLHVLSLLACIEIPGRPFPLLDPLNYIFLPPSCLNGETECVTNCLHWE